MIVQKLSGLDWDVLIIHWCIYPLLYPLSINSSFTRVSFGYHKKIGNINHVLAHNLVVRQVAYFKRAAY